MNGRYISLAQRIRARPSVAIRFAYLIGVLNQIGLDKKNHASRVLKREKWSKEFCPCSDLHIEPNGRGTFFRDQGIKADKSIVYDRNIQNLSFFSDFDATRCIVNDSQQINFVDNRIKRLDLHHPKIIDGKSVMKGDIEASNLLKLKDILCYGDENSSYELLSLIPVTKNDHESIHVSSKYFDATDILQWYLENKISKIPRHFYDENHFYECCKELGIELNYEIFLFYILHENNIEEFKKKARLIMGND